jgi:hypothetical protein
MVCVVGGVHGRTFTFIYNFDARFTYVRRLLGDVPISDKDSPQLFFKSNPSSLECKWSCPYILNMYAFGLFQH